MCIIIFTSWWRACERGSTTVRSSDKNIRTKHTNSPAAAVAAAVAAAARDDDYTIITYEFHEPGKAEARIDRSGRWRRRRLGDPVSREDDAAAGPDRSSSTRGCAVCARTIYYTRVRVCVCVRCERVDRAAAARRRRRLLLLLLLLFATTTTTTTATSAADEQSRPTTWLVGHSGTMVGGRPAVDSRDVTGVRSGGGSLPRARARSRSVPIVRRIARLAPPARPTSTAEHNTYTILYNFIIRTGTRAYYNVILLLLLLLSSSSSL